MVKARLIAPFAGALLLVALPISSALACKGSSTLLRDDFSEEDPAWTMRDDKPQFGNGVLKVHSDPGKFNDLWYGGMNFAGGDACIDIIMPSGRPSSEVRGGLVIWTGKMWNIVYIAPDGTAGVDGLQNGNWTTPVPNRKFDAIKTGTDAVNQLRVVWKAPPRSNSTEAPDPNVTVFINDKQFIRFKAPPNDNRQIGIYAAANGGTFQFKNLHITE